MLFNPGTGKFVMWMHLDTPDYQFASAGVAVADSPVGPFRFLRAFRPAGREGATYRDMNLFLYSDGRPRLGRNFGAQSTFVLLAPGQPPGSFIFLADRWNEKNLRDSRYVWLPFRIRPDGSFRIEWRDRWDMDSFAKLKE